ncbi:MAG: cell division protein ZapA [Bacteroidales bacterium]|nr:cell division protein ZapA [Bacteroidales bacterium]
MDEKVAITLQIAQRNYDVMVKQDDVKIFEQASDTINKTMAAYASRKAYRDKQDLMVMVLLQTMVSNLKTEKRLNDSVGEDYQKALRIKEFLDKINSI